MNWKYVGRWSMTAPPSDTRSHIQGRWSLQSFEVFPKLQPPGRLKGTLTYDSEGNIEIRVKGDDAPARQLARAFEQPRHWQLSGHLLTLTTVGHDGRPVSVARWKKES